MPFHQPSKHYVGVSLKMYFDLYQTTEYVKNFIDPPVFAKLLDEIARTDITVFIIPSFPALSLPALSNLARRYACLQLGAQDCHWADRGAYTGEVSPLMLSQIGCAIVELGHAERRREPVKETDKVVAKKAQAVVRNNMTPLICIGEKDRGNTTAQAVDTAVEYCKAQMMTTLSALREVPRSGADGRNATVIFAYEPVWAIGATEPASADHVLAVLSGLKQVVSEQYDGEVRFLYGGSAGPGTWKTLRSGCDGLFLGRFAHDIGNFVRVIEEVASL